MSSASNWLRTPSSAVDGFGMISASSFTTEFIKQIENNPAYLHVGLMCLVTCAVGIITIILTSKQDNDDDDDDCFSEKQSSSLKKFNEETKEVTEEFVNYEEQVEEQAQEQHPDMVLVIRTDYKTGSQLIKDNSVIQFIDFYPAKYMVLRERDLERYQIIDTHATEEDIIQSDAMEDEEFTIQRRNSL